MGRSRVAERTNSGAKPTQPPRTVASAEIALLIYPDCQLSAVYGLTDVFRIASEAAGALPIRVSHWRPTDAGMECVWDSHAGTHAITHVIAPPSLVVPKMMASSPAATEWLTALHGEGATLCSVCAGAFVLAATGLIDGRRATTHWAFAADLGAQFPKVKLAAEHVVVDDGDIITAGGILAWADLGLTLVERLLGPATMLSTARFLVIDPPRASQLLFAQFAPRFNHGDEAILRIQHHLHAHAASQIKISELHGVAGMTERTFLRRFRAATGHGPNDYLQQVRIAKAREALERTTTPVDRVAWNVGYSDTSAFRKTFLKLTSLTPAQYREKFRIRDP